MSYTNIDKRELNMLLKNEEDFLLLDIRTKEEFMESKIDGAVNVPLSELLFNMDEIEDYKDRKIVIYCRSGHRSITACNLLAMEGFNDLYNLEKGIIDYVI
ncbi:rhodanese-like domain-containing protein [Romboutsia ilealis]|uniref:Rhodanese-like domain-containing protein n=1 Tax=Romboutsia faecis TaxID=2764597 RepID=A0ABR7JKS9_9FIRM|nr:rhodanese-like domain-containing protein [Romboutsia faecis]MBC5995524.1 rhodanese-like domain-containing protein [Romboutsia faecis]MRN23724.1 rhodanese-like domain-containing protein [Romboutsia ilealis]